MDGRTSLTESIRLFVELHELIAAGRDDERGDELRDELDIHWPRLAAEDRWLLDELAQELAAVGKERIRPDDVLDELAGELREFTEARDWRGVLTFLREHEASLPPGDVAALRAMAWDSLGHAAAAATLMAEAVRLQPNDARLSGLHMRFLIRAERYDLAEARAVQLATQAAGPYELLFAADALFDCAISRADGPTSDALRQVVDVAARGAGALIADDLLRWQRQVACAGLLSQALSYDLLGERERAKLAEAKACAVLSGGPAVDQVVCRDVSPDGGDDAAFRKPLYEKREQCHAALATR